MRDWARNQGMQVSGRGRIPAEVVGCRRRGRCGCRGAGWSSAA
ncbi:Lsr2 family DNA-binding protein [Saccharopolyspora shandongensis]